MKEKTDSSEKKRKKFNVPLIPGKCSDKADIKSMNSEPNPRARTRRTVKLPPLKLEDLVSQITEENAHKEVSTGPAVGNEVW